VIKIEFINTFDQCEDTVL